VKLLKDWFLIGMVASVKPWGTTHAVCSSQGSRTSRTTGVAPGFRENQSANSAGRI